MAYRESSYTNDNFDYYIYAKNLQGDVIAIYDYMGTCVASYIYNAWGECTVTNHTTDNIGNINPFRYRGYYYDTDVSRNCVPEKIKEIAADIRGVNSK